MVQLILDNLVNGTPPEAIALNISSQDSIAMPGVTVIVQELPRINFIRSCWKFIRIIGETLVAYCTGKVEKWDQLLSDSTNRHQTALHILVIGVIDEERLRPIIHSTSIILKGETYDNQVGDVLSTIVG